MFQVLSKMQLPGGLQAQPGSTMVRSPEKWNSMDNGLAPEQNGVANPGQMNFFQNPQQQQEKMLGILQNLRMG